MAMNQWSSVCPTVGHFYWDKSSQKLLVFEQSILSNFLTFILLIDDHVKIWWNKVQKKEKLSKTRILRVLHIAIHCPLPVAKIRGPKILEVSPCSD